MKKQKIAIVGYGQFGRFMAKHLRPYYTVVPIQRKTKPEKISDCSIVIFAVPWDGLETAVVSLKQYIKEGALIVDVTSVKQKPLILLSKYFDKHEILGTHPIFGPQSGKNGITDLPIVLCNMSFSQQHYVQTKQFLKQTLGLKIVEQTAKQHDNNMAHIQGLTHFIGRALAQVDIKDYVTNTKSYERLLELRDLLSKDSWELFKTIQNTNPEAKKIRTTFVKALLQLEKNLQKK